MKRSWMIGVVFVLALFFTYAIGFQAGRFSDWLRVSEPPMPTVTIAGKQIEVFRGSYSWSHKPFLFGTVKSVMADAVAPRDYIAMQHVKPAVVSAGAKIESRFDKSYQMSLREFTLRRDPQSDQTDPYIVPQAKGVYLYEILTRWRADQGEAIYFFMVEVK